MATEHFEVARKAFRRTRWNDTQVRITGREVTRRYSLSNKRTLKVTDNVVDYAYAITCKSREPLIKLMCSQVKPISHQLQ